MPLDDRPGHAVAGTPGTANSLAVDSPPMGTSATGRQADIKDSILDTVGETPLVRLSRIGANVQPQIVAKLESFNPGGSIKDRVAMRLVEAAEKDGRLRPGGAVIEPAPGNPRPRLADAARPQGHP